MENITENLTSINMFTVTHISDICNSCEIDLTKAELPIVLILSILLNSIAIIVLVKIKSKTQGIDLLMVLTLAVNDLVTTLLFTAMWIGSWIKCGCMLNYNACAIMGWLASAMVIWSAWVIIIMTGCRYLATVKPIYFRTKVTSCSIYWALTLTLVFTLTSLSWPFFGLAAEYEYYDDNKVCAYDFTPGHGDVNHRIILGVIALEGLLATLVVLYFNFCIVYKLRRRNLVHSETSAVSSVDSGQNKRTAFANVTKVVSAVYCLCYGPFLVRLLYDVITNAPDQNQVHHSITMTLLFMSPLLNPIVYVVCNRRYRAFIVNSCKSLWWRITGKTERKRPSSRDIFSVGTAAT